MNLDITGRNIDITPAMKEFTREKLSKLDRWLDDIIEAHVILSVEKHRHIAEIVVKSRHNTFTGTDETGDMYATIGRVIDKLEKQARRQKDKFAGRRKHARVAAGAGDLAPELPEPISGGNHEGAPQIIRSSNFRMKPMSVEDAALTLMESEMEFLVFRHARSQQINVMYRRRDGNLGLIEPET